MRRRARAQQALSRHGGIPPPSLLKLLLCAGATEAAAFSKALSMAELATEPNNITEVDAEQVYGLEYLLLDLHEGAAVSGSSCGRKPGSGWVLAGGEAHTLACGW